MRLPPPGPPLSLLLLAAAVAVLVATSAYADASTAALAACPPSCGDAPSSISETDAGANNKKMCLHYLQASHANLVCDGEGNSQEDAKRRRNVLSSLRLRHCCERVVGAALPASALDGGDECRRMVHALVKADNDALRASNALRGLLHHYDCAQNYSIAYNCSHCEEAYRKWVCSSLVPHYATFPVATMATTGTSTVAMAALAAAGAAVTPVINLRRIRLSPCSTICADVEQQCPYLLPDQTLTSHQAAHSNSQYAGEPAFLCLDPNIPPTGEYKSYSQGDEDCCYMHCGAPGRPEGSALSAFNYPSQLAICVHCYPTMAPKSAAAMSATTSRTNIRMCVSNVLYSLVLWWWRHWTRTMAWLTIG